MQVEEQEGEGMVVVGGIGARDECGQVASLDGVG